jgi:hypothetical protein
VVYFLVYGDDDDDDDGYGAVLVMGTGDLGFVVMGVSLAGDLVGGGRRWLREGRAGRGVNRGLVRSIDCGYRDYYRGVF